MKTLVLLVHADPSVTPRYRASICEAAGLQTAEIAVHLMVGPPIPGVPGGGLSSRYDALAQSCLQLGKGSAIRGLCQRQKLDLDGFDRVFLATFSAGYAFARHLSAADRELLCGLILIDSGHTSKDPDGTASDAGVAWLVEWARAARQGEKVLAIGHSDVDPVTYASTTQVAEETIRLSGPPIEDLPLGLFEAEHGCKRLRLAGRLLVASFDRRKPADAKLEHGDALTVWGDELVAWAVAGAPLEIEALLAPVSGLAEVAAVVADQVRSVFALSLGDRIVAQVLHELGDPPKEVAGPRHDPRIVAYGKACRRGGRFMGLDGDRHAVWAIDGKGRQPVQVGSETDEEAWCAKARSAALIGALEPGEAPPHGPRVAVAELVTDARRAGTLRAPGETPEVGWAAIYSRAGGNPMVGGTGHVSTVLSVSADTYETGGGNESNTYLRRLRPLKGEPERVAWIATTVS